jgi:hypothetical protein
MDTRNTVLTLRTTNLKRLDRALQVLDVLTNPISFRIIDYIHKRGSASQLDLLLKTGADIEELEYLLESLCIARIIEQKNDLFSSRYKLNPGRLEDISDGLLAFSLA